MALSEAEELELLELEEAEAKAQENAAPVEDDRSARIAAFNANRDKLEPNVMGETEPPEQKLLSNLNSLGTGFGMGQIGAGVGKALAGSKFGKALVNSPKAIGEQMNAGEKAAGVTDRLPELRGAKPRFPAPELNVATKQPTPIVPAETLPGVAPTSYPSDPNTFLNMANARMDKFGNKLSPQEVTDYHRQISDWFNRGKVVPSDKIGSVAAKAKSHASDIRGELIPGRKDLDKIYGLSKTLHPDIIKGLTEHFKNNAGKYLGLGGLGAILKSR